MARKRDRERPVRPVTGALRPAGRPNLVAFGLLAGVLLLFYWKPLIGFPGERTFFWEDFLYQNYPYRAFEAEELRRGDFPFWNPYQFGGMPYAADVQAAAFYPPNLALTLFVKEGALDPRWVEALSVFHALLGGFFFYLLLRSRAAGVWASLLAGIGWSLSGFFVVRMIHMNVLAVVAWAPLLSLLFLRAVERRSVAAASLGGVVLGVSLLGGSPQYSLYLLFLLGLHALYETVRPAEGRPGAARFAPLLSLGVILLLGFGVAAVQLIPTEELSRLSLRADMTYEESTECSFGPASLPTLLLPKLYGSAAGGNTRGYWGPRPYFSSWELSAYPGIVVLVLALVALVYRPRGRATLFFALLGLFGLLLGLGAYGPLHRLFFELVPFYGKFRCPGRAFLLTGVSLAFLAGRGAHLLLGRPPGNRKRRTVLATLLAAILLAGLVSYLAFRPEANASRTHPPDAGRTALLSFLLFFGVLTASGGAVLFWASRGRPLGPVVRGGLLLLLVAELFLYGYGFNDGGRDPDQFYRGRSDVVDLLRKESDGGLYRVKQRAREGMVLPRNMGSVNRIPSVDGYNQLKLQRYEDLQVAPEVSFERMIDLFGVRIYTLLDPETNGLGMARNPDCLPKAFFVGEAEIVSGEEEAIRRVGAPDFDPARAVVLEGGAPGRESPGGTGEATVVSWGTNRIEVTVTADGPGWLVLNEVYYPAWKVTVDGEERESLPADHALRAVRLEAGDHRVVWAYRSGSFRLGAAVSAAALLAAMALLFVAAPRRGEGPAQLIRGIAGGDRP
ncbi:MAG: YfhO family protein [Candidatus Eisenbacteria bacterium]